MISKLLRARKLIFMVDALLQKADSDDGVTGASLVAGFTDIMKKLELKNEDEALLALTYFRLHPYMNPQMVGLETPVTIIDFDKVERLPKRFLQYAGIKNAPEVCKGRIEITFDINTGKASFFPLD